MYSQSYWTVHYEYSWSCQSRGSSTDLAPIIPSRRHLRRRSWNGARDGDWLELLPTLAERFNEVGNLNGARAGPRITRVSGSSFHQPCSLGERCGGRLFESQFNLLYGMVTVVGRSRGPMEEANVRKEKSGLWMLGSDRNTE